MNPAINRRPVCRDNVRWALRLPFPTFHNRRQQRGFAHTRTRGGSPTAPVPPRGPVGTRDTDGVRPVQPRGYAQATVRLSAERVEAAVLLGQLVQPPRVQPRDVRWHARRARRGATRVR